MIIRCIDIETTGLLAIDGVVEVGWTDVEYDGVWAIGETKSMLLDPRRPIPPQASAIHHIIDADVRGQPTFQEIVASEWSKETNIVAFCAHYAIYERQYFDPPDAKWICTCECARELAPMAPNHKLQFLRYWLKFDVDREASEPAHRAGPDTYVTAHLLVRMLAKLPFEELIDITARVHGRQRR